MKLADSKNFPKAKFIGEYTPEDAEWHEIRSEGIGGSEIGTIMGLNQYESAYALWAKKCGLIPTPALDNWAIRFGKAFESPILDLFAKEHPDFELFSAGTYQSVDTPYLHANPDALAKVNGEWVIVEVKTAKNYWYEIPPAYIAQVRHYMAVMDINLAVIVGVVNMTWVEHWIERDEFEEQVLLQQAAKFWNSIQKQEAPAWDGSESTYQAVREMHPQINDEQVEIDGGHYLIEAQENFDKAQAELNEAKSRVMSAMGNAKHAYVEADGQKYRIASRQARGMTAPYLVVNKKGK
jgi:putative phage-type endonuclease